MEFYIQDRISMMLIVAPDIAAALKIIQLWKENRFLASCSLKKISYLRSRHLVLWSLGTLTG
jgi:hypothetical protein